MSCESLMKNLIAISLICSFWSGMLLAEENITGYTKSPMIEPGKSYEACMKLSPGDKLYYEFTSSADLRFNIHYHEGEEVLYPVPVKLTSSKVAVFAPESPNHFCLMWKNPAEEAVELKLRYRKQISNVM